MYFGFLACRPTVGRTQKVPERTVPRFVFGFVGKISLVALLLVSSARNLW